MKMADLKVIVCIFICLAFPGFNFGWGGPAGGGHHIGGGGGGYSDLSPGYYQFTWPQANDIVTSVLEKATAKVPRIDTSLLRLHLHDYFIQEKSATYLVRVFLVKLILNFVTLYYCY